MEVGVLPKPDTWAYHRMKHAAKSDSNPEAVKRARVSEDEKTVDLSKVDSDDEE